METRIGVGLVLGGQPLDLAMADPNLAGSPLLTVRPNKFCMVTHGKGALGDHPRHCICRNASRGLSATAEFLVKRLRAMLSEKKENGVNE